MLRIRTTAALASSRRRPANLAERGLARVPSACRASGLVTGYALRRSQVLRLDRVLVIVCAGTSLAACARTNHGSAAIESHSAVETAGVGSTRSMMADSAAQLDAADTSLDAALAS